MADLPSQSRAPRAPHRERASHTWVLGLALLAGLVLLAALIVGAPPASAQQEDDEAPAPLAFRVQFENLQAAQTMGRVQVDYAIAPADWRRLQQRDISAWISLYVPYTVTSPTYAYAYHVPLATRSGEVDFPDWLSTLQARNVGLCLLGTRPGDNLGLGRGYTCDSLYVTSLQPADASSTQAVSFNLTYYDGWPYFGYFPWPQPFP